jgi:hypothetical protein
MIGAKSVPALPKVFDAALGKKTEIGCGDAVRLTAGRASSFPYRPGRWFRLERYGVGAATDTLTRMPMGQRLTASGSSDRTSSGSHTSGASR